ncbi:MAG TPA: tetratricopeptide repeat protein [Rhodanobacter sp.]|nr:tetratricopeptide repeat protein [Rhodanobacter sp.]
MSAINSIFDGLLGYEKLMLICGFILFVFALLAITVMIVQRRDFKAAVLLIVIAIVLMGFPGIQAVKFSQGMVELDRIRAQPNAPTDPAQKQQDQQTLSDLQQRAGDNPQLLARVSDGYRAIGDVNKAYDLASSVLHDKPSAAVQQTLIPVLTAKLNQVQGTPPSAPTPSGAAPAAATSGGTVNAAPVAAAPAAPVAGGIAAAAPAAAPAGLVTGGFAAAAPAAAPPTPPVTSAKRREIADIASQLQTVAAPLPAASHVALANAYVKLGEPQKAKTNVEQARRLDPRLRLSPLLERTLRSAASVAH